MILLLDQVDLVVAVVVRPLNGILAGILVLLLSVSAILIIEYQIALVSGLGLRLDWSERLNCYFWCCCVPYVCVYLLRIRSKMSQLRVQ